MNILFTICGRKGSKGFKNKNLKNMNGVPLICYTLAAIRGFHERYPEHEIKVALNTDSGELRKIVEQQYIWNDIQYIFRKGELAGDTVAKVDVIRDTYCSMKKAMDFDAVIDLDITSPLRKIEDIGNALYEFVSGDDYDLVFSVVDARRNPYFNMVEMNDQGFYKMICRTDFTMRQQAPRCYEMNASIYVYKPAFLETDIKGTILDYQCGISIMKDYLVLDIDSEEDFKMMSFLHEYYIREDQEIRHIYNTAREGLKKTE